MCRLQGWASFLLQHSAWRTWFRVQGLRGSQATLHALAGGGGDGQRVLLAVCVHVVTVRQGQRGPLTDCRCSEQTGAGIALSRWVLGTAGAANALTGSVWAVRRGHC